MIRIAHGVVASAGFIAAAVLLPWSGSHAVAVPAPAKASDPVLIGTKWKGKLTQKGTFAGGGMGPPEFTAVLTVTKRDGAKFEAELREEAEEIKLTYLVKGEVIPTVDGKGYAIRFESAGAKDVSNTSPILGIPYTGTVTGRQIKGTWRMPKNDGGTKVEGNFLLELTR